MEEIQRIVNNSMGVTSDEEELELPPGFRFHPTDEELITHYLFKKAVDNSFAARAICDVDMNKIEPWDLPWKAKMGEKEWYFFSLRDKKYPTGLRTNRATSCGYWKATGKDKEILKGEKKCLIGMKKTLVFYKGRAPKGLKTNWVSHEFRLQPNSTFHNSLKFPKNEWVLCRVFHKKEGEKKVHISLINQPNSHSLANQMISSSSSAVFSGGSTTSTSVLPESDHYVHCFSNSNSINLQKTQQKDIYYSYFNNPPPLMAVSNTDDLFQRDYQIQSDYQFSGSYPSYPIQDHGNLKPLLENCGQNIIIKQRFKTEERFTESQETGLSNDLNTEISSDMKKKSLENHLVTSTSLFGPHELDCIWNY